MLIAVIAGAGKLALVYRVLLPAGTIIIGATKLITVLRVPGTTLAEIEDSAV
jgi:hypothetical protein